MLTLDYSAAEEVEDGGSREDDWVLIGKLDREVCS